MLVLQQPGELKPGTLQLILLGEGLCREVSHSARPEHRLKVLFSMRQDAQWGSVRLEADWECHKN